MSDTTTDVTLEVTFALDSDLGKRLKSHNSACAKWGSEVEQLHADRDTLLTGAMQTTISDLQSGATELISRRSTLAEKKLELLWSRFELVQELVPLAQLAERGAEDAWEAAIASEMERFEKAGAGIAAMPGSRANTRIATQQLRTRCMQEISVLSKRGEANQAASTARGFETWATLLPTSRRAAIGWRGEASGIVGAIAKLLGI